MSQLYKRKLTQLCSACGIQPTKTSGNFKQCSACKTVHYCSPACQRSHWPEHKPHCNHNRAATANLKEHIATSSADFDIKAYKKWRETRRAPFGALFAISIPRSSAETMCLIVDIVPDADRALDGFRITSHSTALFTDLVQLNIVPASMFLTPPPTPSSEQNTFLVHILVLAKLPDGVKTVNIMPMHLIEEVYTSKSLDFPVQDFYTMINESR